MTESTPYVIVLAGPNGAGKTTASRTVLAETLRLTTFVNADVIAQGLAGFDPDGAAVEASRIMLERLHTLAAERAYFAFETTLAGRTQANWLTTLRDFGYTVVLIYLCLASADLAVAWPNESAWVGTTSQKRLFAALSRSIQNLFRLYIPTVNRWQIFDATQPGIPEIVALGEVGGVEKVRNESQWQRIKQEAK